MSIEKYKLSLKRDVLRIDKNGELSTKGLLKNIAENNSFIKQDKNNNYLIKVISPIEHNSVFAFNKFKEITNVLAEEVYNEEELMWPLGNYSMNNININLTTRVDFEFTEELLKEKLENINDKYLYNKIKSNILDFNIVKLLCGSFKYKVYENKIEVVDIPLDNKTAYGITLNTVNFFIVLLFLGLDLELENSNNETKLLEKANKDLFNALSYINKKYNLKAEESIDEMHNTYKLIETNTYNFPKNITNNKAINLAKKHIKELYSCRYNISGYETFNAESKVLIKDSIAQGVDYNVINEKKAIVEHFKGKTKEFVIQGSRTSKDSYIFENLADDKIIAKSIIQESGVNVPKSIVLTADMNDKDIEEIMEPLYNAKLVVKPRSTNYGTGITVFAEPTNKTNILKAIKYAFKFDNNVLIEEYVKGMEYRFLVIDGKCLSVCNRRPASVVGDGKSTIMELINAKNKEDWHALTGCPVKKDKPVQEYLKMQGLNFNSVIESGKRIFLRTNSNCSTGGESVDYTEIMPNKFKEVAEKAAASFKAKICGVDIIIEDLKKDTYAVIEINDNPGFSINEWSYEGTGEKIGIAILKLLKLI